MNVLPQKHVISHTHTHTHTHTLTYRATEDFHELLKSLLFPESAACIFISGQIVQRL